MTTEQKIIKNQVGVLQLAKQLGNVSQACRVMGYGRDSFDRFKELTETGGERPCARSPVANPIAESSVERLNR